MRYLPKLTLALLLGVALLLAGCSCEDGEAQAPNVEQVPGAPEGQAAQQAPEQAPDQAVQAERPRREKKQRGNSLLNAPTDYLETVVIDSRHHAQETLDLAYLTREIQAFNAMKGRYPESLEELAQWRGEELPQLPDELEYAYDSSTGELTAVPAAPDAE